MADGDVTRVVQDRTRAMMAAIIGELATEGHTVRALSVEVKITTPEPEGRPDKVRKYGRDYTAK